MRVISEGLALHVEERVVKIGFERRAELARRRGVENLQDRRRCYSGAVATAQRKFDRGHSRFLRSVTGGRAATCTKGVEGLQGGVVGSPCLLKPGSRKPALA